MRILLTVATTLISVQAASAQTAKLTALPKNASSPWLMFKNDGVRQSGKEASLSGWLILNGATFPNADFPDLAKVLRKNYARTGYVPPHPDTTVLPNEPHETKANGEIARGMAICPTRMICGDLVGTLMPFDLDASL